LGGAKRCAGKHPRSCRLCADNNYADSAQLRGASEVNSAELAGQRLNKAREMGFVPVGARRGDPVEQITELCRAVLAENVVLAFQAACWYS